MTIDEFQIARAAEILRGGGLVAFPTETVYGLGANALDKVAVQKIFVAKGRPAFNPLIVHLENLAAARQIADVWPANAELLAQHFWPGPLTIVVPKKSVVPDVVTAGLGNVALRVPSHPLALKLLQAAKIPVAAPSANRSMQLSPTTAGHVQKSLGDQIDLILDGGACNVGIESTVLDLSGETPILLRPGQISREDLQQIIGPVELPSLQPKDDSPRASPGMLERHYAPRAALKIFRRGAGNVVNDGDKISGALLFAPLEFSLQHWILMPPDAANYARKIYAALHELDEKGCEEIWVEVPPQTAEWAGVRDRLQRAAK